MNPHSCHPSEGWDPEIISRRFRSGWIPAFAGMTARVGAALAILVLAACGPANAESNECVIAGCSQQLCISKEEHAITGGMSTCEYTPAYGCYSKVGRCEKQKDGKCGWTKSYDLQQCLKNPEGFTSDYDKRDRMDREIDRTRNQIIDGTIR